MKKKTIEVLGIIKNFGILFFSVLLSLVLFWNINDGPRRGFTGVSGFIRWIVNDVILGPVNYLINIIRALPFLVIGLFVIGIVFGIIYLLLWLLASLRRLRIK